MERLPFTPRRQTVLRQVRSRNPKNVKNPKNRFSKYLNWKPLSPSLFRTKSEVGCFRISRKIFGGICGGYEKAQPSKPVKVCQSDCGGFQRARGQAHQDASRGSAGFQRRGGVLDCDGPPSLFPLLYAFCLQISWKIGADERDIQHYSALSRSSEGWGQKALLQTRFPYFVVKYQPETSVTRKHFWPPLKANRKLETFGPCNPLQLNTVTCCQLQPYLCNSQIWPQNGLIRVRAKGLSDCPNHTTMSCPFE